MLNKRHKWHVHSYEQYRIWFECLICGKQVVKTRDPRWPHIHYMIMDVTYRPLVKKITKPSYFNIIDNSDKFKGYENLRIPDVGNLTESNN